VSEKKRDPFMGLDRQLLAGRRESVQPPQDPPPPPTAIPVVEQTTSKDSKIERYHDSTSDTDQSPTPASTIRAVRKAVRERGNEQSIYRLTKEEKRALKDLVYNYGVAGTKTSENEIVRIAINHLISDHKQRGDESVLAHVLAAMNE